MGCEVFLLCMSPGREAGHTRKRELFDSCRLLGIPDSNVILMRHTKLKDDPTVRWREELVSDIILRQVSSLSIDTCVTFDRHGVSGHRNHISLYYALTFLVCPTVYLAGLAQWFQLQRAMMAHWSQYTWFRRLYMLFSRYTLINTLEPMSRPGGQDKKDS